MNCERLRRAFAASIGCVLLLPVAEAGPNFWSTQGPPGGIFNDLEASTSNPNQFYAAYSRSFHVSEDLGAHWETRDFVGQVQDISVDPVNGDRVYVAVVNEGLFRSLDGGKSFTQIAPATPQLWSVGAGPNNVVYYGTVTGVRRSNNGGDSFGPETAVPQTVERLIVDRLNADLVYAIRGPFFVRSTNGFATWTETPLGPGAFNYIYAAVKLASGVFVAATTDGLYTSADDGVSWTLRRAGPVFSVSQHPSAANTLIAAGSVPGPLLRSTDGGATWSTFSAVPRGAVRRALVSSGAPDRYVIANGQGVQRSLDGAQTWVDAIAGPVASAPFTIATTLAANSRVYAWTTESGGGLFHRSEGAEWLRISDALSAYGIGQAQLAVRPGNPTSLFLSAYSVGGFRSSDGGQTWNFLGSMFSGAIANALAFDPQNPDVMYASTERPSLPSHPTVWRSENAGATWAPHSMGLTGASAYRMAIDPANGARMFLAGQQYHPANLGGLHFSANGGVDWNRIAFNGLNVYDVAIDSADSNRIYAAVSDGLHASTNGGASFAPNGSYALITTQGARAIAIDPVISSTLYVASADPGSCCAPQASSYILRSVDRGQTWEILRAAADGPQWFVSTLVLDPNTPSRIYANTGLRGIAEYEIANDLSVSISGHSGERPVGAASTFGLHARRGGTLAGTGVRIVTELPADLVNVNATTNRGSCSVAGRTLTCTLAVWRPAEDIDVSVSYTPPGATYLALRTTISAHEGDVSPADNVAVATATAGEVVDLQTTLSASAATVDRGDAVGYSVEVRNGGPLAASAATLTLTPANGVALGALPAGCVASGGGATCDLGAMAVGATRSFTFSATAQSAGSLTTTARATQAPAAADANPADNEATSTVVSRPIADVGVAIADTVDPVVVGVTYEYRVTVRNEGPDAAPDVRAVVTTPGAVNVFSASAGSCAVASGAINCSLGQLAAGASATITVSTAGGSAGSVTARASVTAAGVDRGSANNEAQETTTITSPPPSGGGGGGGGSGGGGGGGGALGAIWLLALLGAALHRSGRAYLSSRTAYRKRA